MDDGLGEQVSAEELRMDCQKQGKMQEEEVAVV